MRRKVVESDPEESLGHGMFVSWDNMDCVHKM